MYKTDLWELKYFKDEDAIEIVVPEMNGSYCNGFASIPCYGEDDMNYEDQWEIATLLVAAPKLLDACQKAIDVLIDGRDTRELSSDEEECFGWLCEAVDEAKNKDYVDGN